MSRTRRFIASVLVVSVTGSFVTVPAQAAIVTTASIAAPAAASADRAKISRALARADVRAELLARGVNPADVQARVNALSDDEAAQVAKKIDSLPAGGDILGALIFVFLVLLITDILGLTKVFPFTRSINRK